MRHLLVDFVSRMLQKFKLFLDSILFLQSFVFLWFDFHWMEKQEFRWKTRKIDGEPRIENKTPIPF
jgi:hypothetical protein